MTLPLLASLGQTLSMLLLGGMAIFLILLVLVQRGRGGGLAGALGGMGGSSAFGAKAGDMFTKITAIAACVWIIMCIAATKLTPSQESLLDTKVSGPLSTEVEQGPALSAPPGATDEDSDTDAGQTDAGQTGAGQTGAGQTDAGQAAQPEESSTETEPSSNDSATE